MGALSEQLVRDRLMDVFISKDELSIRLNRPVWVATASGGRARAGYVVLPTQSFGFIPFKRRLTIEYMFTLQNRGQDKVEYIHYILIFNRDSDITTNDFFIETGSIRLDNGLYTVEFVSPRQWDRGQAGILYRG